VSQSFAQRLRRQLVQGVVPKCRLPGDTPGLVRALHALNDAGLLKPNCYGVNETTRPCPRCGRLTAVWRWTPPWVSVARSVCTGCRVEEMAFMVPDLAQSPKAIHPGEWNRLVYGRESDE
jgi:hypothetical protein